MKIKLKQAVAAAPALYRLDDIVAFQDSSAGAARIAAFNFLNSAGTAIGSFNFFYATSVYDIRTRSGNLASLTISSTGAIQFNNGYGAGTITSDASGNLTSVSDERQKHVQGFFTRGLESLKEIRPIFYKWTKESGMETEHTYAGMSAQNVALGIPEAVNPNQDGWLGLSDRAIIGVLINACNQLAAKVELLEARG